MDDEYRGQLRERLKLQRRLLHERLLQLAKAGMYADPSISIAAEDLQAEVYQLERELGIERPAPIPYRRAPRYEAPPEPEPQFQQRMVGQQIKARQADIEHQMGLLKIHRSNMAHYRAQARAHGGVDFAPPVTRHGMQEQRSSIARIKDVLRAMGQAIDDLPGDE